MTGALLLLTEPAVTRDGRAWFLPLRDTFPHHGIVLLPRRSVVRLRCSPLFLLDSAGGGRFWRVSNMFRRITRAATTPLVRAICLIFAHITSGDCLFSIAHRVAAVTAAFATRPSQRGATSGLQLRLGFALLHFRRHPTLMDYRHAAFSTTYRKRRRSRTGCLW